jgi:sec-independent protein translocase protein TatA
MFGLGVSELLIILAIVFFLYGGKRLPQIGEGLGKMIAGFKKAHNGEDESPSSKSWQVKNAPQSLSKERQTD